MRERVFKRAEVRECIEIDASMEEVWKTLSDLSTWEQWNTVQPVGPNVATEGRLTRVTIPGPKGLRVPVKITFNEVTPPVRLVWSGSAAIPGMLQATHGFELQRVSDTRCRLIHFERFRGALVHVLPLLSGGPLGTNHRLVNEQLAARFQ